MLKRDILINWMNDYLQIDAFKDYCPNGLQVKGNEEIIKISCAVSSSLEIINKAVESKSDLLLVHHGLIWKGEWNTLTGTYYNKIKSALDAGLNIVAYHLPLDAHIEVGNAASLASILNLINIQASFEYQGNTLGVTARNEYDDSIFYEKIKAEINKDAIIIKNRKVEKVGIVTGAGHNEFKTAIDSGIDTFISGEATEWIYHMANENNVNFIAAGHHATERFGVQNLAKKINETFSAKIEYHNENNPF